MWPSGDPQFDTPALQYAAVEYTEQAALLLSSFNQYNYNLSLHG